MKRDAPTLFRRCVQCPDTTPTCPSDCASDGCVITPQTCDDCATAVCMSAMSASGFPQSSSTSASKQQTPPPSLTTRSMSTSTSFFPATSTSSSFSPAIAVGNATFPTKSTANSSPTSTEPEPHINHPSDHTIPAGSMAGIAIAMIIAVGLFAAIVAFCFIKRGRKGGAKKGDGKQRRFWKGKSVKKFWYHRSTVTGALPELETKERPLESGGVAVHEAPNTQTVHMAGGREISELGPGDALRPRVPSRSVTMEKVASPFDDAEMLGPHNVSTFALAHRPAEKVQEYEDNRELELLQEEMARVRERRERLEELHALSEREAELKRAIASRRVG